MKKTILRILSLTLAMVMALGLASFGTALAAEDNAIAVGSTAPQFLGHFDCDQGFSTECSTAACYLAYDQLFSIGSDGVWYSDILADYGWSDEAENQMVLTLKDGILFSNGDEMTASDVLYSMKRFATSARGATNFSVVDFDASYVSDDNKTLYLQYNQTYGPWQSGLNIFVMNEDFVEGLGEDVDWFSPDSVCGSGPYAVAEAVTDISITFEKRDDWWMQDKAGDSASIQTITVYAYTDDTTMMADYMNGVVDVVINLTAADCEEIEADPSMGTYVPVSSYASAVIVFSPENEILQNADLRKAICLGTDGAALANLAWGVLATPSTSTLNEANPYYVAGHSYEYDPEAAAELVAASGIENPTLTWVTNQAKTTTTIAEAFQFYMQQIGVTVNIETYDQATAVADYWTQPGGTDLYLNAAAIATASNEAADVYTFYRDSFPYPCTRQTDPVLTGLLEDGRASTDDAERVQIYSDVQDYFYDNYSMIPVGQWSTAYAYNTRIASCDIAITGSPSLRYITLAG